MSNEKLDNIIAKSPEEKKIVRLERELAKYKDQIKDLEQEKRLLENSVIAEREWRRDFQRLLKAAAQEDNLTEYERRYW